MAWKVTTDPASEPLTNAEVKNYIKMPSSVTADDDLIDILIESARRWVEGHCNIGVLPQTVTETFDGWPDELSVSPLRSVSAIQYKDSAGATQTLSSSSYVVDHVRRPPRIGRAYNVTYPFLYDEITNVSAVYTVGYDAASAVPAPIKRAILLTVADAYENRENYVKRLPTAAEYVLQSAGFRIWSFR